MAIKPRRSLLKDKYGSVKAGEVQINHLKSMDFIHVRRKQRHDLGHLAMEDH